MWRSFFIALGLAAAILGGELLAIDKATFTLPAEETIQQRPLMNSVHEAIHTKDFVPPEWAPWTLLSVGIVVVLYSSSLTAE